MFWIQQLRHSITLHIQTNDHLQVHLSWRLEATAIRNVSWWQGTAWSICYVRHWLMSRTLVAEERADFAACSAQSCRSIYSDDRVTWSIFMTLTPRICWYLHITLDKVAIYRYQVLKMPSNLSMPTKIYSIGYPVCDFTLNKPS